MSELVVKDAAAMAKSKRGARPGKKAARWHGLGGEFAGLPKGCRLAMRRTRVHAGAVKQIEQQAAAERRRKGQEA